MLGVAAIGQTALGQAPTIAPAPTAAYTPRAARPQIDADVAERVRLIRADDDALILALALTL